jgi:hypothetical protein
MFFKVLACLILERNQYEVFACFFENTNSKSCSESSIKFLFRLSLALIGQFLEYIQSRLSEQFSESQSGLGTTL